MYLLKPNLRKIFNAHPTTFTFHHVSIKTHYAFEIVKLIIVFTFHHVSIKTLLHTVSMPDLPEFTFHHVSIKTNTIERNSEYFDEYSHSTMYLLKPVCTMIQALDTSIHIPPCIY